MKLLKQTSVINSYFIMDTLLKKYTAIKLKGFNYYVWFETEKTINELSVFIGKEGWGKGGTLTNIKCSSNQIESYIYSDELQYL